MFLWGSLSPFVTVYACFGRPRRPPGDKKKSIVVEGENWHQGVIGIVASKLTEKYLKPVILLTYDEDNDKGGSDYLANISYELTFALVGLILFAFMKWKRVKFELPKQGDKLIAAVCETAGQLTYVYAMSGNGAIAAATLAEGGCCVAL